MMNLACRNQSMRPIPREESAESSGLEGSAKSNIAADVPKKEISRKIKGIFELVLRKSIALCLHMQTVDWREAVDEAYYIHKDIEFEEDTSNSRPSPSGSGKMFPEGKYHLSHYLCFVS